MSDPLRTIEDYELFLYSLPEHFPSIRRSTLVLARRGATIARVAGELAFDHGFRLVVREAQSVPAANMSFQRPNLPVLVEEIDSLLTSVF